MNGLKIGQRCLPMISPRDSKANHEKHRKIGQRNYNTKQLLTNKQANPLTQNLVKNGR